MDFSKRPAYLIEHDDQTYEEIMARRLALMTQVKEKFRIRPEIRCSAIKLLGTDFDPPRYQYDYLSSLKVHNRLKKVPFRKDVADVETLQFPDITLSHGGDCDDLSILAASYLESIGIETRWMISKQFSEDFDHIAVYIPSINSVMDLTIPGKPFPVSMGYYNEPRIV